MTKLEFDKIVRRRLGLVERTLIARAKEYATDADRLHNFKEAALLEGCSPADALRGFALKHWVSVRDVVRDWADPESGITFAQVDEKIGDAIAYLCLLECVLVENLTATGKPPASG